jgi:hypothetical protein
LRAQHKDALQKTDSNEYNQLVDDAESKLKALDKAQDEYEAFDTQDAGVIDKQKALEEAEAAAEQSLETLQGEFSARSSVLPGASRFANGNILYNQGGGVKAISAWTDSNGPLQQIQRMAKLDELPVLGVCTGVDRSLWNGAAGHYQVYRNGGGMLDYDVIQSRIDGQVLWSWIRR